MRWKKIATLSAVLATALFAGLFIGPASRWILSELKRRADAPDPVVATPDETRAILAAVLAHASYEGVPPPPGEPARERPAPPRTLILSDRSLCLYRKSPKAGCGDGDLLVLFSELDSVAPLKLRTELVMANREMQPVSLNGIAGTRVVPQTDIDRALHQPGWWREFYRQFGNSAGMARITRPVLSHDRSRALILVDHLCDGLCGSVTLFALERRKTQWQVSETFVLGMR